MNNITDLSPLMGLTHLAAVSVSDNPLTHAKVNELRAALPNAHITYFVSAYVEFDPLDFYTSIHNMDLTDEDLAYMVANGQIPINITGIWFHNATNLSDISPVALLTELTSLYFSSPYITDWSPLYNLPYLTHLSLGGEINDISFISNLPNLDALSLYDTAVTDISALEGLVNLHSLTIMNAPITDITPLASLTGLYHLGLSGLMLDDLTPLASLTSLTGLSLSDMALNDMSALSYMLGLQQLVLWDISYGDISTLDFSRLGLEHTLFVYLPFDITTDIEWRRLRETYPNISFW
jgi:internalin A